MAESEEARPYRGLHLLQNANSPTGVKRNIGETNNSLLANIPPKECERRKVSKSTQVDYSTWITEEDISSQVPSEHFWQNLAKKRRVALDEALRQNEKLSKLNKSLKIELGSYKYLVDVVKDLILEDADDTGIDVEDLNESA